MTDYYSRQGNPISQEVWLAGYEDIRTKRVAEDHIGDKWVSTVHLGLNHCWDDNMAPLIFETMVFHDHDDAADRLGQGREQWRWATEKNAQRGHKQVIAWLLGEGPEPTDDSGMTREEWDGERQGQEGRVAVGADDES